MTARTEPGARRAVAPARRVYAAVVARLPRRVRAAVRLRRQRPLDIPLIGAVPPGAPEPVATMLVVHGVAGDALDALLDVVLERSRATGLRLLLLTDCDDFHRFRRRGLLFEYVPPRHDVDRRLGANAYDGFLARRLAELGAAYHIERTVVVRSAEDLAALPAGFLVRPRGNGSRSLPAGRPSRRSWRTP